MLTEQCGWKLNGRWLVYTSVVVRGGGKELVKLVIVQTEPQYMQWTQCRTKRLESKEKGKQKERLPPRTLPAYKGATILCWRAKMLSSLRSRVHVRTCPSMTLLSHRMAWGWLVLRGLGQSGQLAAPVDPSSPSQPMSFPDSLSNVIGPRTARLGGARIKL